MVFVLESVSQRNRGEWLCLATGERDRPRLPGRQGQNRSLRGRLSVPRRGRTSLQDTADQHGHRAQSFRVLMARTAFTVLLLLLAAAPAKAGMPANPEAAWREYFAMANDLEPRYAFPYANCFRRAAANYELPETLLLAVARGESDF